MMTFKIPHILQSLIVFCVLLALSDCFNDPEKPYQFGDISRFTVQEFQHLKQARLDYCHKVSSSKVREAALKVIRLKYPLLPVDGICTELTLSGVSISTIEQTNTVYQGPPLPA